MGEHSLTWEECVPVVEAEVRRYARMGAQLGLDADDLRQEASIAALQCLKQWQQSRGGRAAYVRRAVRNRFATVRRDANRERRMPHDAQGRAQPAWLLSYDANSDLLSVRSNVDYARLESRWMLRVIERALPERDWKLLVQSFIEGAHLARGLNSGQRRQLEARLAQIRADARRIIRRTLSPSPEDRPMAATAPSPVSEDLPECHALGEEPQGYDRDDGVCWNCRDKFTCLPEGLSKGLVEGDIGDDNEVEAVQQGHMTMRMVVERMRTRLTLMERGAEIPEELRVSAPIAPPKPPESPPPPPEPEPEPAPVQTAKVRKVRKTVKKAPVPDMSKLVDAEGRPTLKNGKPLPPIRPNTPKQMGKALKRVRIGQPFPLRAGMQLVRRTKQGDHVIVKIKPLGFELDGVLYSALSTAIMYRLRKMQSGNDYFHLDKNQCTEIWDEDGNVLAGHSLL